MVEALNMPQVGQDIPTGKIITWRIAEGEPVRKGDIVCEVESEKASFEVESTAEGVLLKQLFEADSEAEVFKPIAWIGHPGDAIPGGATEAEAAPEADITDEVVQTQRASMPNAAQPVKSGRVLASPSARRIARERGVDLASVAGSGPGGRIVKRDVLASPSAAPAPAPAAPLAAPVSPAAASGADEVIAFDRMRQIIADRLLASRQTIPDFTVVADVDMTPAMAWRKAYNQGKTAKVTVNDLVVRAVAQGLRRFPRMNSHVSQNQMVVKAEVNIGIAVAIDGGLLVPVLPNADALALDDLAAATKALAADARRGVVKPGAPGTFSISNLGSSGITRFFPIINPPECAILGVGAIEDRVVSVDGMVGTRQMMTLTLTCDHRAVDGAYAAGFLDVVKQALLGCGF